MSVKPYEFLGPLPTRVDYARRYRVRHRVLGKTVEFRVLPQSASPAQQARYRTELEELLALDHPCFPPVLERGMVRNRHAYVVPLREHPTIPERIAAQSFFPAQAFAAVVSLAGGLAAQHDLGMRAGPIEPKMVSWDDRAVTAYFLQRRHQVPRFLASGEYPLPEDVRDFERGTPRSDVFHWGLFAYFLLSRGKFPYQEPGRLVTLESREVGAPRYLRVAVEAALSWRPEDRPESGGVLQRVLLVGGGGGFERPGPGTPPGGRAPRPEAVDMSASRAFQAILVEVDEMHMSLGPSVHQALGRRAVPGGGQAATSEAPEAAASEDPPAFEPEDSTDDDEGDLSVEVYQSGSGLAAVSASDLEEVPGAPAEPAGAEDGSDTTAAFARDIKGLKLAVELGAGEPAAATAPGPGVAGSARAAVAALVLGLGLGWMARGCAEAPEGGVPGPAPAVRPEAVTAAGGEEGPGEVVRRPVLRALPASEAQPFRADGSVMQLLQTREVPPEKVAETWKAIRSLMLQGRLPTVVSETERLTRMRQAYEADPAAGPRVVGEFLDDLRIVLGPPPKAGGTSDG